MEILKTNQNDEFCCEINKFMDKNDEFFIFFYPTILVADDIGLHLNFGRRRLECGDSIELDTLQLF